MQPKYKYLTNQLPKEAKVILAPSWLVEKLEENSIPLSVLSDGKLPDILSTDELIFYYNYHALPDVYCKALGVIRSVAMSHETDWRDPIWEPMLHAVHLERSRLMAQYDNEAMVTYLMSVVGPDHAAQELKHHMGVELKTKHDGNHLIVSFGPASKITDPYDATEEVFEYVSRFVSMNDLLQSSLYAYLVLGPTGFKGE